MELKLEGLLNYWVALTMRTSEVSLTNWASDGGRSRVRDGKNRSLRSFETQNGEDWPTL